MLSIKNLRAFINGKEIIRGINLKIKKGEIVFIMGPNGSGKSTLANGLMGNPKIKIKGFVKFNKKNLLKLKPENRSEEGIFLSFQHPEEIHGLSLINFLRIIFKKNKKNKNFEEELEKNLKLLKIEKNFLRRELNVNFSGGERKKIEMLQLAMLKPKLAILDEVDSGLDMDSLKSVCDMIKILKKENKDLSFLIITHYQRILTYLKPNKVYIMLDGKIVKEGEKELIKKIEKEGYLIFNSSNKRIKNQEN